MERGRDGQQRADKQSIATECENWLRSHRVKIQADSVFGRADMVARKKGIGTVLVEVEGDSSRQKEQAMYSALGQIVLYMRDPSLEITYALAVPDDAKWAAQLRKVPNRIQALLNLQLWLVSESGVRNVED
jgi:hypothetical protein